MFNQDFDEFIKVLYKHKVECMLVGGYAYVMHVEFRYTKDLDVWVKPTPENLERLNDASQEFLGQRFDVAEILAVFNSDKLGFKLCGVEPLMIEVLLQVQGSDFDNAIKHAMMLKFNDVQLHVIHSDDQIRNKRAAGRLRDLADVEITGETAR